MRWVHSTGYRTPKTSRTPICPNKKMSFSNSQLRSAVENLETLGMAPQQIEELARTREYTREILVYAPATSCAPKNHISRTAIRKGSDLFAW